MYPAIDIHAHFGDPACFPQQGLAKEFLRLPLPEFRSACARSHIAAACASPMEAIFPKNAAELLEANRRMAELSAREALLYQWVVLNPLFPESYAQAEQMLESPKCVGIKLHPDGHGYALEQYGRQLFAFCAGRKALVEIHTGDSCSDPELLVPYANQNPELRIIAAHVGYGGDGAAQIRAIQRSTQGNLYADISSARSLQNRLLEWAVEEVGAERLLFGTDTPIHHMGMMRARVDFSDLEEAQKKMILFENASRLTGIPVQEQ